MTRARLLALRGIAISLASSLTALPITGLTQDPVPAESGSMDAADASASDASASADNDSGENVADGGDPDASATATGELPTERGSGTGPGEGDATSTAGEAGSSVGSLSDEEPRPRPRLRRRRRHGRRRARGPRRARPPVVTVGWRVTAIPTEGVPGTTHAFNLALQPASRYRTAPRYMRFAIGGEIAVRESTLGRSDGIVWLTLGLGAHYPGRVATPYVAAVTYFGFANRYRFARYMFDPAYTIGLEAGVDLRAVGFAGIGLAVGVGRTVIGDQYSYAGWFRATLALW